MPPRAARPCTYPGCGALVRDGSHRCVKHPRQPYATTTQVTTRIRGRAGQRMRHDFLRDNPICAGPDSECQRHGRVTVAAIRDHRIPLAEGGADDVANSQALCEQCHDLKSEREAMRGVYRSFDPRRKVSRETAEREWPEDIAPSRIPVTMVCGPPGAGKSTYVRQHATADDLIIDLDRIIAAIAGVPEHHTTDRRWLPLALEARNDLLRSLSSDTTHKAAWFIVSVPDPAQRDTWARRLGAQVVVLAPPMEVCVAQLMTDHTRTAECAAQGVDACRKWYADAVHCIYG
jgi:5-methylcytosine-specific restriction protein A